MERNWLEFGVGFVISIVQIAVVVDAPLDALLVVVSASASASGFQMFGQRRESADVIVDLVNLVVLDVVIGTAAAAAAAAAAAFVVVLRQRLERHGRRWRHSVVVEEVEQIGSAATQKRDDRNSPLLAVEAEVLAEMRVVDLRSIFRSISFSIVRSIHKSARLNAGLSVNFARCS